MPSTSDWAYVRRMTRSPALLLAAALTSLAALAGCSLGGGERVGGEPAPDAHVLTMLTIFDEASAVRRRGSDGVERCAPDPAHPGRAGRRRL